MTDTSAILEHGPYVLLLLASLFIGFMPFLMIHLIEPSVPAFALHQIKIFNQAKGSRVLNRINMIQMILKAADSALTHH